MTKFYLIATDTSTLLMAQIIPNKVTYTYLHCSSDDFAHEVSFSEDDFNRHIGEIFNTSLPIDRVELEFNLQDKKTGHFVVTIRLLSPGLNFHHQEETYGNYSSAVHKAINKAIDFVRSKKDKLVQ